MKSRAAYSAGPSDTLMIQIGLAFPRAPPVSYWWMHAPCRIAAAFATLLSLLAPAMACAMPGSQMTAAEHACCRQMKGRCGSMHMPASHNCCQTAVESGHTDRVQPQAALFHVHVAVLAMDARISVPASPLLGCRSINKLDQSPPPAYRPLPAVLRI